MKSLKFAMEMELDGEKFYLEQAEINKDNSLSPIFKFLAKEKAKHADLIRCKMEDEDYELLEEESLDGYKNVFKGIKNFHADEMIDATQTDAYRYGLKKEKESIELYEKLREEATDEKSKELFSFLLDMEKNHYRVFEEMVHLLRHGEEWVEDAEFGKRGTY